MAEVKLFKLAAFLWNVQFWIGSPWTKEQQQRHQSNSLSNDKKLTSCELFKRCSFGPCGLFYKEIAVVNLTGGFLIVVGN